MRLITSLTSPYGRIVRILVAEHGLEVDVEVANPWQDRSKIDGVSPLSKIPVLVLDDGTPIVDSWVIAEHLDSLAASPMIPAGGTGRAKVLSACAVCHDALNAGTMVVSSRIRGEPLSDSSEQWHLGKAAGAMSDIERRLGEGEFGREGAFGYLDVTAAATLGFFEFRLKDDFRLAERFPKLAAWYHETVADRPSIRETMPPQQ